MEKKAKVPKLRFSGFTGEWERCKLGEVATLINRTDATSTAPIMMISAASGFISQSEKYSNNNAGNSLAKYIVLKKGELAYNHGASKQRQYGSCFALNVAEARIPFVYHCFSVGDNNPNFIGIELNDSRLARQLRRLVSSGARMDGLLNISFDEYKTVDIFLPCLMEQHKVAAFFAKLDNLITLHQRKLTHLQNQKKSLLQKMFPKKDERFPELRFPGFTDAWEQHKLGELAEFNPKTELPDNFEYVDLESVVGTEMVFHRKEKRTTAPSRAQRLARQGDLFYQMVRPYQKNNYLFKKSDSNYVFSTGYAQMRPNCDSEFLFCLVQTDVFVRYVSDRCTGTSYPVVNVNELANMEVAVSNNNREQKQIGNFFIYFDNLINLHQRKLTHLQTQKKALLQQMFV